MNRLMKPGLTALALLFACAAAAPALALTQDQARENCRATVGHPLVQACKHGGGDVEKCRETAKAKVRACVQAAMTAANGRADVPVAVPKEQGPSAEVAKEAAALPTQFVAPPRTITDITAILDSEKPDPAKIAKLREDAAAPVPAKASREQLVRFYYGRGQARSHLGQLREALADADKAVETGRGGVDPNLLGRVEQFAAIEYLLAGDPKHAMEIFQRQLHDTNTKGARGFLFGAYRQISQILIKMGDLAQAEAYLQRNLKLIQEARTSGMPGWRKSYAGRGQSWESDVERHRAVIFEARGQFPQAEKAYRLAEQRRRASVESLLKTAVNPPPMSQLLQTADTLLLDAARMEAKQGRLAEAEADARRALLARLKDQGKYNPVTPIFIGGLSNILIEQGRYAEAEKLTLVALEINRAVGVADDSQTIVGELSRLATIYNLQHKRKDAIATYAEIDKATANWDPRLREAFDLNGSRINSLYAAGDYDRGVAAAEKLLKRQIAQVGEKSPDVANTRANLAVGYMRLGRDADAAREFETALPILMAAAQEGTDGDSAASLALRRDRLQSFVENYITLLNLMPAASGDDSAAVRSFGLADAIRGQSVQKALAESSARAQIKDPALAELVRQEQDLSKQVDAQLGTLNNALALPSGQRDETGVKALNVAIANLRQQRDKLRADIAKSFPSYANLIAPKPPSVDDIKAALKPDEALLSFYFGREKSFVWALPKNGKVAFAVIPVTAGELATRIHKLRKALEPDAATVSDIPPFDLAAAYDLYKLLLKPVEPGWKQAKSLIVVTNGALGLLPLSLLPTAPVAAPDDKGVLFAGYRGVPWLARTHAVSMVPSISALRTLRQLPAGLLSRDRSSVSAIPISARSRRRTPLPTKKPRPFRSPSNDAATTTRGAPLQRRSSPHIDGVEQRRARAIAAAARHPRRATSPSPRRSTSTRLRCCISARTPTRRRSRPRTSRTTGSSTSPPTAWCRASSTA